MSRHKRGTKQSRPRRAGKLVPLHTMAATIYGRFLRSVKVQGVFNSRFTMP
jgi:hypothetical protein